jgi:hypothetical protein
MADFTVDVSQLQNSYAQLGQALRIERERKEQEKLKREQKKREQEAKRQSQMRTIGSLAGAAIGGATLGPAGIGAGASIGSTLGGAVSGAEISPQELISTGAAAAGTYQQYNDMQKAAQTMKQQQELKNSFLDGESLIVDGQDAMPHLSARQKELLKSNPNIGIGDIAAYASLVIPPRKTRIETLPTGEQVFYDLKNNATLIPPRNAVSTINKRAIAADQFNSMVKPLIESGTVDPSFMNRSVDILSSFENKDISIRPDSTLSSKVADDARAKTSRQLLGQFNSQLNNIAGKVGDDYSVDQALTDSQKVLGAVLSIDEKLYEKMNSNFKENLARTQAPELSRFYKQSSDIVSSDLSNDEKAIRLANIQASVAANDNFSDKQKKEFLDLSKDFRTSLKTAQDLKTSEAREQRAAQKHGFDLKQWSSTLAQTDPTTIGETASHWFKSSQIPDEVASRFNPAAYKNVSEGLDAAKSMASTYHTTEALRSVLNVENEPFKKQQDVYLSKLDQLYALGTKESLKTANELYDRYTKLAADQLKSEGSTTAYEKRQLGFAYQAMDRLDEIEQAAFRKTPDGKTVLRSGLIGRYDSIGHELGEWTNIAPSAEYTTLSSAIASFRNMLLRAGAGTAQTEQETKNILQEMVQTSDSEVAFMAKWKSLRPRMNSLIQSIAKSSNRPLSDASRSQSIRPSSLSDGLSSAESREDLQEVMRGLEYDDLTPSEIRLFEEKTSQFNIR